PNPGDVALPSGCDESDRFRPHREGDTRKQQERNQSPEEGRGAARLLLDGTIGAARGRLGHGSSACGAGWWRRAAFLLSAGRGRSGPEADARRRNRPPERGFLETPP